MFAHADKLAHVGVFLLLALTARWRFTEPRVVLPLLVAYAVVSELVQGLVLAQRSGDPVDVLADLVGVALGWSAARRLT